MKSLFIVCAFAVVGAVVGCSSGNADCPTGWSENATSPGKCAPSAGFVADTQTAIGTGVYGFMRDNLHGGTNQLIVGAKVFAIPSTQTTCDAASVNATASATTDAEGTYRMALPAGDYLITSGEVQACTAVHVDANQIVDVALTTP